MTMDLDAALQLLDKQLIDRNGRFAGKVDDLELTEREDGRLVVTAILSGPGALGPRLPGVARRSVLALWRRLHGGVDPEPARIDFGLVTDLGTGLTLAVGREDLPNQALERWAYQQIISKLPGADHAAE
jgi:sporulation protein YlmC with PRC-barrel domain